MKKMIKYAVVLLLAILVTSCGMQKDMSVKMTQEKAIDQVLQSGIDTSLIESKSVVETSENESIVADTEMQDATRFMGESEQFIADEQNETTDLSDDESNSEEEIDIDLTQMSSDMVYATVYQLMVDPYTYQGRCIRIKGNYYATWYEPTAKYYHYAIIQDATACCAQGMEFIWGDGGHTYPDEYPEENQEIIVTGIFDVYTEEGDENLYCRLLDADMEKVRNGR